MATATDHAHVIFDDVHMAFGQRAVLCGLTCEFPRGKISVILGGSGSGKTTVLRLIGGLVHPQRGRIVVAGDDISQLSELQMYRVRAKLGMMFQGGALLDSLTIFDNLAFPLREHARLREVEIAAAVHQELAEVGLAGVENLLPGQLSGGMIKRAALARAIVMKPEILLCDEPFSGLDPISVKRIEALLHRINRQLHITMLISSHHIPSTMRMADEVVLLLPNGATTGTPVELQQHRDPHIAGFFNEDVGESIEGPEVEVPGERTTHRWVES
ncbi:MAG TPA: ATP-binding cassette domain-containing protein [Candidatus Kryptonia bacterium]|nr:ATP-binding cassette domain-containing protein [Candidatus Kryptonia bacterium]